MVVPLAAGGPLDATARLIGAKLAESMGQPFVVDNRPGAAGNIGMELVADAAPNGYTILWALDAMLTVNPLLYKNLGDPLERLRPVAWLTENTSVLAVHPSVAARNSAEFVRLSHTKDISYASAGSGSPGHRYMEFYKLLTGARVVHVPYKGNAPAVQSLLAGQTQSFITPIAGVLAHLQAGKLRALGVTSGVRSPALPDVPTFVEQGFARLNSVAWFGVLVPAKTPQDVVNRLQDEILRAMKLDDVGDYFHRLGQKPVAGPGKELLARVAPERKLWAEVVERSGMKVD